MHLNGLDAVFRRNWLKSHWLFTLAGLFALLATRWNFFYGHTVDVGFHYALTNEFFRHPRYAELTQESLGAMYNYPPGAHLAAALLSFITRYPLLSINVLCDVAIFGAYVAIALFLVEENFFLNVWRLSIMLVAVWVLTSQQAAFGYQVILNFFFPQLLGEAIVFALLYVLSRERFGKVPWAWQTTALVATVWLMGYVQPLAALQLATCVAVFSVLSVIFVSRKSKERPLTLFVKASVLSMLLLAAVIFQPAFMIMQEIALNDGYLRFGPWLVTEHYAYLVTFGIGSAGLAIAGVRSGKLERRRGLTLASCTLGGVALIVAQRLLVACMNLGSEYAVGKHVFFLATSAIVTFSYASALFLPRVQRTVGDEAADGRLAAVLPVLFSLVATYLVFSAANTWRQELPPILQYQSSLEAYRQYSLPVDAVKNIASLNKNFTPVVNYAVSGGGSGTSYGGRLSRGSDWRVARCACQVCDCGRRSGRPRRFRPLHCRDVVEPSVARC